jgi:hypothetical protein
LPDGPAVTASDIATAINSAPAAGLTASADTEGRLVLTATTAASPNLCLLCLLLFALDLCYLFDHLAHVFSRPSGGSGFFITLLFGFLVT